jgi:DNA-binding NtrC family response regulator
MRIFASARIAVLDSDPNRRSALCEALSGCGMLHLLPVGTVEEARTLANGAPVDLCVVDATGLARNADGHRIPINPFDPARTPGILIAADITRHTVKAAMASGYRLVVPAPVVPRILYRRIGSVLQKVRRESRIQSPDLAPAAANSAELRLD